MQVVEQKKDEHTLGELVQAALVVLNGLPDALEHIPAVLQAAQFMSYALHSICCFAPL